MPGRVFLIFLFLLAILACNLSALNPEKTITQYVHDVWKQDKGLPTNHITKIAQTNDGYLWLGTLEGLVRFDGVRFQLFDKQNTKEIKNNLIWELMAAKDGSLWIGTFGGGVTQYKNGLFTHYGSQEGLSNGIIISLYEDPKHQIWIGTRDGGLNLFKNGRFKNYGVKDGLINNSVNTILQDKQNATWIGTNGGLCRLMMERVNCYTTKHGLPDEEVQALLLDRNGDLWIGTDGGGVSLFRNEKFQTEPYLNVLRNSNVETLLEDKKGNVWIGTHQGIFAHKNRMLKKFIERQNLDDLRIHLLHEDRNGNIWAVAQDRLVRITGTNVTSISKQDGLAGSGIHSIFEDFEGSIWIGTNTGLSRLADGKFLTYTTREGLSSDSVGPIYEDHEKNLWIGTLQGSLSLYKNGKFTVPFSNNILPATAIFAFWRDRQSNLWIGSDSGVFRIQSSNVEHFEERDGLTDRTARAIYEDKQGSIWVGTEEGLSKWNDGKFKSYTVIDGLSNPVVRFIFEDSKNNLWIGTDGGLNLFKNGRFQKFPGMKDLTYVLRAMHEDKQGTLWIGTIGNGLFRFRNGLVTNITSKHGLADDTIFQLLEDDQEYFWMSCNKGIFSADKKELELLAENKSGKISSDLYNQSDGMKSSECRSGVYPPGWKTSDGHLWFSTEGGLVRIDPTHIYKNRVKPPVILESLVVDDELISNPIQQLRKAFDPGKEKFEFHYTALSFVAPEKVQFKYKLEGFDTHWTNAGTRRVAFYTHIPHGLYTFKVIASNNDGLWNEVGALVSFDLKPHFYQTKSFYFACALLIVFIGFALHLIRIKQMKSRFAAVIAERNRISHEIHDTLAQSLVAISLQLKMVEDTMHENQNQAQKHLDLARNLARNSQIEARRFVHDLRPHPLENSDLPNAVKETAQQLIANPNIQFEFNVKGHIRRLSNHVENNLLRVSQEAVSNCVRHAEAHSIQIELVYAPDSILLSVQDDGKGFAINEAENRSGHHGLSGMSERIEQIGGTFEILSQPGKGTHLTAQIPT